jgi:adenylosuccinate synthase
VLFRSLRVSEQALVITPFHQAANRIREMVRGENRHGSCGVGVGEAVEDALLNVENCVRAGDLANPSTLRRKLRFIREQKRAQLIEFGKEKLLGDSLAGEWEIFESEDVIDRWIFSISRIDELGLVVSDLVLQDWLHQSETAIFEGAQGVLLDADAGFHPFTTWSRCTAANAYDLIATMAPGSRAFQIGVMRSYAVRHGPGPLPTETDILTSSVSDHNKFNEWQGSVRYGWFDAVWARYALSVAGKIDSLVVTHLDVPPRLKEWKYCIGYRSQHSFDDALVETDSNGLLTSIHPPRFLSLVQREQFTRTLATVTPVLETCETDVRQVIQKIESLIGQPIGIISSGPRAENIQILSSIPA